MNGTVEFAGVVKELATAVQASGKTLEGWLSELSSRLTKIERKLEEVVTRMASFDKRLEDALDHMDRKLEDMRLPTLEDLFEVDDETPDVATQPNDGGDSGAEPEAAEEDGVAVEWGVAEEEHLLASRLRERLAEKGVSLDQDACVDVMRKLLQDVQAYVEALTGGEDA